MRKMRKRYRSYCRSKQPKKAAFRFSSYIGPVSDRQAKKISHKDGSWLRLASVAGRVISPLPCHSKPLGRTVDASLFSVIGPIRNRDSCPPFPFPPRESAMGGEPPTPPRRLPLTRGFSKRFTENPLVIPRK